jgi:hypothetical protein
LHTLALPALRRRALIATIFAGHVVWLHLLQDNIFDPAKFRKRCEFDASRDHDVLKHSTFWRLANNWKRREPPQLRGAFFMRAFEAICLMVFIPRFLS